MGTIIVHSPAITMRKKGDITVRVATLAAIVGLMWVIRAIDSLLPRGHSIAGIGIVPRVWVGLYGIPVAPFIHASWPHLIANTIPLLVLGSLVMLRGAGELSFVFVVTTIIGGLGTWIFGAGDAQHIGASGIIFGLFGFLICRAFFDRKLTSVLITLIVGLAYGTAIAVSLIPEPGVSWSGHFFGFLGGVLAARLRYPRPLRRPARLSH